MKLTCKNISLVLIMSPLFVQCSIQTSREDIIENNKVNCMYEAKVNAFDIYEYLNSKDWNNINSSVKRWALCFLNKSGIMTREGVFQLDVALARTPSKGRELIEYLVDHCLSTKAIPPGDIAWIFLKCYRKSAPSRYQSSDLVEYMIDTCLTTQDAPPGDKAWIFYRCYKHVSPKIYQDVIY